MNERALYMLLLCGYTLVGFLVTHCVPLIAVLLHFKSVSCLATQTTITIVVFCPE